MNLKIAKEICDRQGLIIHIMVPVICPHCDNKTLLLDVSNDNAYCYHCQKNYKSIGEVLILENERWRKKHARTIKEMEARKGVVQ